MIGIPGHETFVKIEPIRKGLPADQKYYIETADGRRLLLRVNDAKRYEDKKAAYEMMERAAGLDIHMSRPVEFGFCDGGGNVYMLLTWCYGEDVETALPRLSGAGRYALGIQAGAVLRKIHSLPAPADAEPWGAWFRRKVQKRTDFYHENPLRSESGEKIVRYLAGHQSLLDARPQTFHHGDANISNLIAAPDGTVGLIDFNAFNRDHGDPWREFAAVAWGTEPDPRFSMLWPTILPTTRWRLCATRRSANRAGRRTAGGIWKTCCAGLMNCKTLCRRGIWRIVHMSGLDDILEKNQAEIMKERPLCRLTV